MNEWATDEMMAVEASRRLANSTVCFVGIGLPSLAANLALRTHAPECVLVYESGAIGAKPVELPLSIGDGELTLVAVHPGVSADDARAATGWKLKVADVLHETEPPSERELAALRALKTKGAG